MTEPTLEQVVGAGRVLDEQPVPPREQFPVLERGKVYESVGPNGEKVNIMTEETWTDFGTNMQTLRQAVSHLNRQLKEAHINERVLLARLTDRETRLENLRAVRRAEKRPEVEAMISSPNESTPTEG